MVWVRRPPRLERGQATVELALIVPVLAMLAFGALDVGRVFTTQIALVNAAREGARYCARHPLPPHDPLPRVTEELGPLNGALVTSPAPACAVDQAQHTASISLEARLSPITPLVGTLTGNQITLTAAARMPLG